MNFHRFFLKTANSLVSLVVILFLTVAGVYSGYALWDNAQVYAAVDDVQSELLKLKPDAAEEDGASFEELLAVNPDVCAWLTLDNTGIDYPVVQGEDNLSYINTDVYGEFALAGFIFLDSSCDNTFHDQYSLLYGHHMENSKMFGDLDLYEDEEFFNENTTGMLILPDRSYELEILPACGYPPRRTRFSIRSRGRRIRTGCWSLSVKMPCTFIRIPLTESGLRRIFRRFWPCLPVPQSLQMREQFFWR